MNLCKDSTTTASNRKITVITTTTTINNNTGEVKANAVVTTQPAMTYIVSGKSPSLLTALSSHLPKQSPLRTETIDLLSAFSTRFLTALPLHIPELSVGFPTAYTHFNYLEINCLCHIFFSLLTT